MTCQLFFFIFSIKKKMKIEHRFSFFIFQLSEKMNDPNIPDLFTSDLATKSDKFLSIFSEDDINYKLATFHDTFLSTLDAHAPIKSIRIRSRPCPYVTPEIKDQMTFRDQLFRRYRQSRNADAWKAYKEARRSVKQLLKNAECDHIRTEVRSHKDNPGSLWKIINPKKKKLRFIVETLN